ncbi:MAG: cell division protein ZipA [Gammaproteobacteria bacterium]|jgi:cell division protein ZipA
MDKLRLTLLIVGCFIVLGIYLWEIFYKASPKKKTDILDAVDEIPDIPLTPLINEEEDYSAAMADLGSLLTLSRDQDIVENDIVEPSITPEPVNNHDDAVNEPPLPLEMSVNDYETELSENNDYDVFAAIEEDIHEQEDEITSEEPEQEADTPKANQDSDDLLVLYITSPAHTLFNGLSISKGADEIGMVYGHMNIFHHFGPGKLHSGQPLFSLANMHEPGSFDLGRMADLKTKGIVAFMYSPASIDASVVFELYLNTTQRMAELLGGDIRTSDNELLNTSSINTLRDKAASFSDN